MIKTILRRMLGLFAGKARWQKLFESAHYYALLGMNYGVHGDTENSGEINGIKYVLNRINNKQPIVLFDVGANVGDYALLLSDLFGDKNTLIYSFEPSKTTFNNLQSNLSVKKNIFLHNFGFGDENKIVTLFSDAQSSGLASVYKRRLDHYQVEMGLKEEIEIRTIDDFCRENKIGHINLLKIDVEGNEFNVLKGAGRMLANHAIDFIQFEFGGCNIDSRIYYQDFYYLLNPKYEIFRILKNGLHPMGAYSEKNEIFLATNYLAVNRKIDKLA